MCKLYVHLFPDGLGMTSFSHVIECLKDYIEYIGCAFVHQVFVLVSVRLHFPQSGEKLKPFVTGYFAFSRPQSTLLVFALCFRWFQVKFLLFCFVLIITLGSKLQYSVAIGANKAIMHAATCYEFER